VQDRTGVISDGDIHERVRDAALDLRSHEFVSIEQAD